jgi:long-chain acyl-CoA synthetase
MYLTQSLRRAVQVSGREIATVNGERRQTYAELLARVRRLAGAVRNKLGLAVGGRAAILALNSDRYIEFSYAMPWAGCVFVPINTRLAPPEIAYWLADSGAEVLFVDDAFLEAVAALAGKTPSLRELIYIGAGDTPEGMHAYEDLIAEAEPIEDVEPQAVEHSLNCLCIDSTLRHDASDLITGPHKKACLVQGRIRVVELGFDLVQHPGQRV